MKNGFELDYANNPDLRALFDSKSVGEECTLTVKIQVNEKNENRVVGSIREITAEDYDGMEGEDGTPAGTVEADSKTPAMVVMVAGPGKSYGDKD